MKQERQNRVKKQSEPREETRSESGAKRKMPLYMGNAADAAEKGASPGAGKPAAQSGGKSRKAAGTENGNKKTAGAESAGKEKKPAKAKRAGQPVKIIFLGGVGEIGKNMTALEYGNDIIIIDAGLTFPDEELPGIDLVIPDISYLTANSDRVRGLLVTHGHEDHLGGIPYLLKEMNIPVYGTKLTLALADNKIREHRIQDAQLCCVQPGDRIKLGVFDIEFINVNHSIAGALALCIRTPQGIIFHSGDFKIDLTPVAGQPIDLARIAEIGREGVRLLLCESTNVERPGYTMSETVVGATLDRLFDENASRRIIIATFASNVHRLQQIADLAVKHGRKVALSGRSMLNVAEAASKIGELSIPEGTLIDVEKIGNQPDSKIVIVSTGSQGEPMSALTRMASGEFNRVKIGENDTIIISASPIPGNEKMIYNVINNLYRKGARVVYETLEKLHVSGHACQEELKILHSLLNPEYFIPVHGEYRHLRRHADLAMELGMPESRILIADIGNCVELSKNGMMFGESVSSGSRLVDGGNLEDRENSAVMKDRKHMSEDGIFVITACVSSRTGELLCDPSVVVRGFVMPVDADYAAEAGRIAVSVCDRDMVLRDVSNTEYAAAIQKAVKNFVYRKTKQNPVVMANIVRL